MLSFNSGFVKNNDGGHGYCKEGQWPTNSEVDTGHLNHPGHESARGRGECTQLRIFLANCDETGTPPQSHMMMMMMAASF